MVSLPQIHLSPRMRKIARIAGIVVLGILAFMFALQATLPVERARDKLIETLSPSYDVTIGKVERGIKPGRVYFKSVSLRSRPTKPDEQVNTFFIEELKVDLGVDFGLIGLIKGKPSVDFNVKIGAGDLGGNVQLPGFGKKGIIIHASGRDLPGDGLPMRAVLGLPMTGKLDLALDLDLPAEPRGGKPASNWQKAEGEFEFGCPNGCTFGDGKTKLKPLLKNRSNQVMVGEGIDFGKVEIDSLLARGEFKDGNFTVTKFDASSHDGELHVDYTMKLEPDLMDSTVTGCLRFKGSDALLKREPKTYAAIQTTGAELRGDGLFHITLADHLREMRRLNQECGPNVQHPENGRTPVRPNITVMPDEPKPAIGSGAPPPPPPPIAPPPTGVPAAGEPPPPPSGQAGSAEGSAAPGSAAVPVPPPGSGAAGKAGEVLQKR